MTSMLVDHIELPAAQERLTQRIEDGRELLRRSSTANFDDFEVLDRLWTDFTNWHNYNGTWLDNYLGREVRRDYEQIVKTWREMGTNQKSDLMINVLPWEISKLELVREHLPQLLSKSGPKSLDRRASQDAPIFIVHGRDTLRAESVAHTVASATGRKAIILREQPNSGRTLIEKFEENAAEVSYAIIILTGDDKGSRADETDTRPRGRQNVIFEMGYFYGLLGRRSVSVLLRPGVEKPSDTDGIAYITFDDHGIWKAELLRELRHAGFNVQQ
jgi:predicted nucleotide-binding protein